MAAETMIPIERLSLVRLNHAKPGTLLLAPRDHPGPVMLALMINFDGKDEPFALSLDQASDLPFRAGHSTAAHGTFVAVDRWRLLVDPMSLYSPTNARVEAGDAFLSEGVPGFVGWAGDARAYISVAGAMLPDPGWTTGYVGFRSWDVVVELSDRAPPIVIASRRKTR